MRRLTKSQKAIIKKHNGAKCGDGRLLVCLTMDGRWRVGWIPDDPCNKSRSFVESSDIAGAIRKIKLMTSPIPVSKPIGSVPVIGSSRPPKALIKMG